MQTHFIRVPDADQGKNGSSTNHSCWRRSSEPIRQDYIGTGEQHRQEPVHVYLSLLGSPSLVLLSDQILDDASNNNRCNFWCDSVGLK